MKNRLANAIMGGGGTARERLRQRKGLAREQPQGTYSGHFSVVGYVITVFFLADVLRWGKTYWQAAAEHADRPKVDIEADAVIEGSLAAEASLIVLDTVELLVQTLTLEAQSMLGILDVLLHLMGSNQSTEVMECVFATWRTIVCKFPELVLYEESDQCAQLCACLLRRCSSPIAATRALACASLYLLMRQNFELQNVILGCCMLGF